MAATCASCGVKLGLGRRMSGHQLCESCEGREQAQRLANAAAYSNAVAAYQQLASQVPVGGESLTPQVRQMAATLTPADAAAIGIAVVQQAVTQAIADEYLTADEEATIDRTARILGIDPVTQQAVVKPFANRVLAARMNAGRFEPVAAPSIFLKPNETDLLEVPAQLLKEVVHREMRGGYSGVSFRVAKGVRFHTGGYRGKSV